MEEAAEVLSPLAGYAAWAATYDVDGNPLIPLEGPAVREMAGNLEGRLALDLGCGTGRHSRMLLDGGARVLALDQSPEMMARGRQQLASSPILWVRHALPRPLPIPDRSIDVAILGLVIEHVVELETCLCEVARVLKPGGRCVVSALHPDRTAAGQRARFIDPQTGIRRPIQTIHRTVDQYQLAAAGAGLIAVESRSLAVTADLVPFYPRSARYVGLNLGWVGCWSR